MRYDEYFLSDDAYDAFQDLNDEEKILFFYSIEAIQNPEVEKLEPKDVDNATQPALGIYNTDMPHVDVIFDENICVIRSDNESALQIAKNKLFSDGMIMSKIKNEALYNEYYIEGTKIELYIVHTIDQAICPN